MTTNTKSNLSYKVKVEKLPNSQVKVLVTVPSADFETCVEDAKKKVLGDAKLNGFRDGKVPYEAFVKNYGEFPIRQEMGYVAVDKNYVQVIVSEKIEAIGKPEIQILKVTPGEDFEYQILTDVLPEVDLPDYKKLHKEIVEDKIEDPSEDEVSDALEELRRMRITKVKKDDGTEVEEMPEIDEKFLKSVGDFKTVEDLKIRIKENIMSEKKWKAEEKRKGEIFEKLIAETKTEIPNSLVENELSKMQSKITADLSQMGVSFEDYLKHMKKTLGEWKESEIPNAKKSVILQLALHAISKKEDIKVSEETLKGEVSHLMTQYKDVDEERARAYSEERMTNTLVGEFVTTGKVPDEKEIFGSHEGHNH